MNNINFISASQLSMFDECPRKWWAYYVLKIDKQEPSPAANLGNATHKISEISLLAAKKKIEKYTDPKVLIEPAVKKYQLSTKDRIYLSMMLDNAKMMGWFEDCENSFPELEKIYFIDNVKVKVKIDRLLKTPDIVRITDLKTSKYPYDINTIKQNWQTRLYALPFIEEYDKVQMEFWFLRYINNNIKCVLNKDDYDIIINDIRNMINKMNHCDGSEFKSNKLCKWCSYLDKCKL